ncbi:MAG: GIY-YIG nuclease family protein [Oceanipulchritudo sp.]
MRYVYRLASKTDPNFYYTGCTGNLKCRLRQHNAGDVRSTRLKRPYRLVFYAAFPSRQRALAFEAYLKTGSGHAFARKRLW